MLGGFRLTRSLDGKEGYTGSLNEYLINPANTTPIFKGDPVRLNGGYIEASAANEDMLGVFQGVRFYDPATRSTVYREFWDGTAGRENVIGQISQDPHMTYHCVWNVTTGGTPDQTDIGAPIDIIYAAGSAVTGDSAVTIGAAIGAAGGQVFVLKLADYVWGDNQVNSFAHPTPVFEVAVRLPQHRT